jgi:hypothetical protein
MSSIKLESNASGTGIFTIASPNSNTNRTLTLPDNTGTVITTASTVSYPKGGPTFGAAQTNAQTITRGTFTKLQYNIEDWDTASCYDPTTNYRFTPNIAGYYQVNARMQFGLDTVARDESFLVIYKNGSAYKRGNAFGSPTNSYSSPGVSVVVYLNGSTDYIEAYIYYGGGSATSAVSASGGEINFFQAFLARAD